MKLRSRQFKSCLRSFKRRQDCLRHNKCLSASSFFPEGDVHRKCCAIASATNFLARRIATSSEPRSLWLKRSEEHTSELQSRFDLVCRLLLEKKKKQHNRTSERTRIA